MVLRITSAEIIPTLDDCKHICDLLGISNISYDDMFDELTLFENYVKSLPSISSKMVWTEFFRKVGLSEVPNLFKILSHVMSISSSNSFCESLFSLMNRAWSDERNCLSVNLLKCEICINKNFDFSC